MSGKPNCRTDPHDQLRRTLQSVEDARVEIQDVYRDDPAMTKCWDFLQRKRLELRAQIHWLVERN
jgi:hypothetical protein